MAALPNVPSVLKLQMLWNDSSDTDVSSIHFLSYSGTAPTSADLSNFCASAVDILAANNSVWTPATVLTGARATDLTSSTAGQGEASASHPGTLSGSDLAGGTAVVVNYTIARRYRGGKPRNYFPWGSAGVLATRQTWNTGYTADVASAVGSWFSDLIGTSVGPATISNHVNVSYYLGTRVVTNPTTGRARNVPILRTAPLVDAITARSVLARPGSQRRRNA